MLQPATVVLVHGAWHGAWCWDSVLPLLEGAGIDAVAVDLPMTSLADDSAVVSRAVAAIEGPVVLVGHSYGGAVITDAGTGPNVGHLVYLCAFQVDTGEPLVRVFPELDLPPTRIPAALRVDDDGVATIDPDHAVATFYGTSPEALATAAIARLRPLRFKCFTDTVQHVAWRTVPSTFAVCALDEAIHPDLQRAMAARADHVVEWDSDHSPFLSRPETVADLLIGIAVSLGR